MLLAVSAILFQRAATAPWTEARATDGTRYVLSPIGLTEFKGDNPAAATACRWWPRFGNQQLCALNDTGGSRHMAWLRWSYPLTVVALWMSVLALFLNALKVPRQAPRVGALVALVPAALAVVAVWSIWTRAPLALAVLEGLEPSPVWTGVGAILAATLFTATAAALIRASRR